MISIWPSYFRENAVSPFIFNKTNLREKNHRTKRYHFEVFVFLLKGYEGHCTGWGEWVWGFQEGTGKRNKEGPATAWGTMILLSLLGQRILYPQLQEWKTSAQGLSSSSFFPTGNTVVRALGYWLRTPGPYPTILAALTSYPEDTDLPQRQKPKRRNCISHTGHVSGFSDLPFSGGPSPSFHWWVAWVLVISADAMAGKQCWPGHTLPLQNYRRFGGVGVRNRVGIGLG